LARTVRSYAAFIWRQSCSRAPHGRAPAMRIQQPAQQLGHLLRGAPLRRILLAHAQARARAGDRARAKSVKGRAGGARMRGGAWRSTVDRTCMCARVRVCACMRGRQQQHTSTALGDVCCPASIAPPTSPSPPPLLSSRTPSFPPSFPPSYLLPPPSLHPSPFPPSPPPTQDRHQDLMHEGAGKGNEHANVRIGLLLLLLLPAAPPSTCRQLQRFLRVHVCACVCMRE